MTLAGSWPRCPGDLVALSIADSRAAYGALVGTLLSEWAANYEIGGTGHQEVKVMHVVYARGKQVSKFGRRPLGICPFGFEKRSYDYIVISPNELLTRLRTLHPNPSQRYQVYVWVTQQARAWLTRELRKEDQQQIADNSFVHPIRDLTEYLNNWRAISDL